MTAPTRHRQREEIVRGLDPYLDVKITPDGTKALATVSYWRRHDAKGVRTTTFGRLELGLLTASELACVGRTVAAALAEMQETHQAHLESAMDSVRRVLR